MVVALDCETPDLLWDSRVIGFSTYNGDKALWWTPKYGFDDLVDYLSHYDTIIMHNAKFDLQKLMLEGIWGKLSHPDVVDTEAMAHLLDEHRLKGLKTLAKVILGEETDEAEKLKAVRKELGLKKSDGFAQIPVDVLIPYALKDAEYTYKLYEVLWPALERKELLELFWKEMELTFALLEMEGRGMAVDTIYLQEAYRAYNSQALRAELELRDMVGREDFNPRSDDQVREFMNAQGIHSTVLTEKSKKESFNADVLKTIDHPFAVKLLHYKKDNKLCNTFLGPMLEEQVDGLLHVNIRQHGTVTGRVSSGEVDRE